MHSFCHANLLLKTAETILQCFQLRSDSNQNQKTLDHQDHREESKYKEDNQRYFSTREFHTVQQCLPLKC